MRLLKKLFKIAFLTVGGLFVAFLALGAMISAGWIQSSKETSSQPTQSATTQATAPTKPPVNAAPPPPPKPSMPADEAQVIAVVRKYVADYKAAPNDMAKGGTRPLRTADLCKIGITNAVDWQGTVETLSSNNDGNGVLAIRLSPEVAVKTWNNALSDAGDQTLLANGSKIYQQAVQLRTGQQVKFSGSLLASKSDCFREGSVTVSGAMTSPEFLFKFSTIEPLE